MSLVAPRPHVPVELKGSKCVSKSEVRGEKKLIPTLHPHSMDMGVQNGPQGPNANPGT